MISIYFCREELQQANLTEDGFFQKLYSSLSTMKDSLPTSIVVSKGIPFWFHFQIEATTTPRKQRTPRKPKPKTIDFLYSPGKAMHSPKPSRHLQRANYVAVRPDSIWYESYITIEPVPEGINVDRDAEKVKHEFEHILTNVYLTKPPKKKHVFSPSSSYAG